MFEEAIASGDDILAIDNKEGKKKEKIETGMRKGKFDKVKRELEFHLVFMKEGVIFNTAQGRAISDFELLVQREYNKRTGWKPRAGVVRQKIDFNFLKKLHEKDEAKVKKERFLRRQSYLVAKTKLEQEFVGMSSEAIRVSVLSTWVVGFFVFAVGVMIKALIRYRMFFGDFSTSIAPFNESVAVTLFSSDVLAEIFGISDCEEYQKILFEMGFWLGICQIIAWLSSSLLNIFLKVCEFCKLFRRYRLIQRVGPFGGERKFKRFVDDMCLAVGMCNFKDPASVVAFMVFAAKQFTNDDSIIERISEEVRQLIMSSSTRDIEAFGNLNVFFTGMAAEACEGDDLKAQKMKLKALWKSFQVSDLGVGLCRLLLIMVTTGALPEFNWNIAGVEVYSLRKSSEVVKAGDLFEAIDKILTGVAEGVARFEATGKFSSFFSDDSLESRVANTIAQFSHISTGSIEMYAGLTEAEYADNVNALKKEVGEKMATGSKSDKFYFKPYLDRLSSISQQLKSLIVNEKVKKMPYAVLLVGNSGTGKSHTAEKFLQQIMLANGVKPEADKIITVNNASAYDDEVLNKTRAAIFDDLGNAKPRNTGGRSVSELVIKYLNNVSQMAYKADVDSKNSVRIDIDFAVGTTNVAHLNTASETNNKASIKRRFKYDVTMFVKPEYCVPGSTAMDEHLVEEHWSGVDFPPIHYCKLERTIVTDSNNGNGDGYKMKLIQKDGTRDWWELAEVVQFCMEDSVKHFEKQKRDLQRRKDSALDCELADLEIDFDKAKRVSREIRALKKDCPVLAPMMFKSNEKETVQSEAEYDEIAETLNHVCETDVVNAARSPMLDGHSAESSAVQQVPARTYLLASDPPPVYAMPGGSSTFDDAARQDMFAVLDNNPELMYLVRCGMSWKHYFFMSWTPYFVQIMWVKCGCKLSHFLLMMWFMMCPLPIFMICYGGLRVRSLGCFLVFFLIWFLKDMSLNMLAQTMFRSAVDRRSQQMWRVMVDDIATTHFMVKLTSAVLLVGVLKSIISASSLSYTGLSLEDEKTTNASKMYKRATDFIANTAKGPTLNMTDEHIINAVKKNCVVVYAMDGESDTSLRNTGGFFVTERILMVPKHFKERAIEQRNFVIETFNKRHTVTIDWEKTEDSAQYVELESDFVMIQLTGIPPFADVQKLFCKRPQRVQMNGAKAVTRNPGGTLTIQNFFDVTPRRERYKVDKRIYTAEGYRCKTELPMIDGSCMTVVVKESPSPEVLGFHIAGIPGERISLTQKVTQDEIACALKNLTKLTPIDPLVEDETILCVALSNEIHPLCPSRLFPEDFPVSVVGSVPGTGPRRMKTEFTPFHDEITGFFGGAGVFGIPPGRATRVDGEVRSPWKKCVEDMLESKNLLLHSRLAKTSHAILEHFKKGVRKYVQEDCLARPLSLYEATNGIPGVLGANGVNINTSAGIGFGKTKKHHVVNDEHPWKWNDRVEEKVEEFVDKLKRRVRPCNILNASLKDEPLKAKKCEDYATRVFFCDALDALLVCMMWFSAPMNFMSLYNGFSHCALGLNASSYDWDWLFRFLKRQDEEEPIPDEDFICLDFKGFDKTLPENLMQWAWWILVGITEEMPEYTDEDREIMRRFAYMKCTPYIAFNGTLLQFYMLHTSGNGCTAHIGSLAGLILITMVCLDIIDEQNSELDVWDVMRSIHLGDDCVISVKRSKLPQFNFIELQKRLKDYGITITPADKEAEPSPYQNVLEYDFLKRSFVWCDDRQSMVAPLDTKSFVKALGFVIPSKVVPKKHQWGSTINTVLFEAAFHGKEFFENVKNLLLDIAAKYELHAVLLERSYEDFVVNFAVESGKRYPQYREKEKPFVERAFAAGNYPEQWQQDALGKIVKEYTVPEESNLSGMSGEIHIHVNIMCCFKKCCRIVAVQHLGDEQDVEDVLSSSDSGPNESKSQVAVLDDTTGLGCECPSAVLAATPLGELKTRAARILPNG